MGMVYYVLCILYSVACILYPVFGDRRRKEGGEFRGEGETENRRLLIAQPRRPAFLITEPPPPLPPIIIHPRAYRVRVQRAHKMFPFTYNGAQRGFLMVVAKTARTKKEKGSLFS